MITLVGVGWLLLSLAMVVLWYRQTVTKNATSVDVAWSAGLLLLACLYTAFADGPFARRIFVGGMMAIWAGRLATYLLVDRVIKHEAEDGRYRALRAHWGPNADRNFFFFYQAQALVAVVFSLPALAAMRHPTWAITDALAAAIWIISVLGELTADLQLARFRANPENAGSVCRSGWWRYSRHPNYFFEWMHWWSYVLAGRGALLTLIGPVAMWLFLFRLTGIPYTEMQALKSRGAAYRRYQETTNKFIPWFPRGEG